MTEATKIVNLEECASFQEGYVNPSQKIASYFDGPVKWLRAVDLNDGYVYNTSRTLSQKGFESAGKSALLFEPESLAISKSGTIGRMGILKDYMCGNRAVINIRVDREECDNLFIFYVLLANRKRIEELSIGSVQRNLYASALGSLEFLLPPREQQRDISSLLSSLDEKIELNRKQNRTLEAIAQALFKHWFVDFEFPDENGRPYKSSGGAMQPSELGEIPVGWCIKPLDQVADYLNGLALQKFPPESDTEYLPVIKIRELKQGISANSDRASTKLEPKYIVEDGDVLFSWSGSLEVDIWCGGKGALNQHLFKVTSSLFPKWFYFLWTKHHLRAFKAAAADKATTMGHIQRSHLSDALTMAPPEDPLKQMNEIFEPIIEKIILNRLETRTLAKTRDTLLPKLMSGELRVAQENIK